MPFPLPCNGAYLLCPICGCIVSYTWTAMSDHLCAIHKLIHQTEEEIVCACGYHSATHSSMGDHLSEQEDLEAHLARAILSKGN